jgi:FkbM family methyltransferase
MTTLLFDIGANVGKWALENAKTPTTRIVCVEASPATYYKLMRNVHGKNINVLNRAVTSEPISSATFYEAPGGTISSLNKDWIMSPRSRFGESSPYQIAKITSEIKVPTTTIDAMIATYGMPDLIKVDVEGAEHIVLPSLTQKAKTVCFEWASEWDHEAFLCIDHMVSLGYTQFHIQYNDEYAYRPAQYELTADDVKAAFKTMKPYTEWGMIWCQ